MLTWARRLGAISSLRRAQRQQLLQMELAPELQTGRVWLVGQRG